MRVLAAMSGGVDSAVAAARAVEAGHDVVGVHLALSRNPATLRTGARGCCTAEDAGDARRAADVLGIPFYIWDLAERFQADVIDDFVAEYAAGRTPNPCLRCNEKIKFTALLDKALALGFDAVCTGHYARVETSEAGGEPRRWLARAADAAKDQSYVLAVLTPEQLSGAMFPLGDTVKSEVRREAERRGLAVAAKADSHDICFIADGDTAAYLKGRLGSQPGEFVDSAGKVVGQHDGAYAFTVGQRHGLRLGVPAADGKPRYVLGIEPVTGRVQVGGREQLDVSTVVAEAAVFPSGLAETGLADAGSVRGGLARVCRAQVRAHAAPVLCRAGFDGSRLTAELDQPVSGVAAGQGLVLYDGDRVLAAGRIASAA